MSFICIRLSSHFCPLLFPFTLVDISLGCDCFVCDTDSQAVEEIRKKGIDSLDVVIANAAVNLGCGVGFKDVDVDLQEETFRINVSLRLHLNSPFSAI